MTSETGRMFLALILFLAILASLPLWGGKVFGSRTAGHPMRTCLDRMRAGEVVGKECRPESEYGRYGISR